MAELLRQCHGCRHDFPTNVLRYEGSWEWCGMCLMENRQKAVGIPSRYRASRLSRWGYLTDEAMAGILSGKSLFVCGLPGRGKTDLVLSMANGWLEGEDPGKILFWEWEWFIHLLAEKHGRKYETLNDEIHRAAKCRRLILDDLGGSRLDFRANDYQLSVLWRVINERYNENRWMAVTSNKTIDQVAATFDDRIASRLNEVCFKIFLDGKDWRAQ